MRPQVLVLVALLAAGLVVGFGAGAFIRPVTHTETLRLTLTESVVSTTTVPTTLTTSTTATAYITQTTSTFITTTVTSTIRTTTTSTATTYVTYVTTVYPAERGTVLVSDRGSGDKETRPFTLDSTADLRLKLRLTARADLRYVGLSWYLYQVGATRYFKSGSIDEEQGVFEFYLAAIPAGNWYVKILAANCNWELTVEKVT
ncbi:MAG: hypothetical protein QXU87_03270 [Candidatus Caldarchaeum sp.]